MTLGEKIKACRQRAGLSQEKLAERVGVSRQAVTKWEANQSAPHTENLFQLAEALGTTVDFLLTPQETGRSVEAIDRCDPMAREAAARRERFRANIRTVLTVMGGYLLLYLAGRLFGTTDTPASVLGWLFGSEPGQHSYLYGWLLDRKLFWGAMAVSVLPAWFGKRYFSFTTLFGFAAALLLGELCGPHPVGAAYGHGHYGWAIWGGIFALSMVMGILLQKISPETFDLHRKKIRIWAAIFAAGLLLIVVAVRASMPAHFS